MLIIQSKKARKEEKGASILLARGLTTMNNKNL